MSRYNLPVSKIFLMGLEAGVMIATKDKLISLAQSSWLQFRRGRGTVPGGRKRGRQKKRWEDNIKEWTGLELSNTVRKAES